MLDPTASRILAYYDSLESRIGYRLFLGGTRHLGYYSSETSWPWPITTALRRMEGKLMEALGCSPGATVLDAGCGAGHVALYMAREGGFCVEGIDLAPRPVAKARRNVRLAGMSDRVSIQQGDYHNLEAFDKAHFDGIYSIETVVHATDTRKVLQEFFRVLKPGGSLAMHEYDHVRWEQAPKHVAHEAKMINIVAGMPAFESFETGDLERLVRDVGFEDVVLTDMSKHVVPMLWLFYIFAYIPHLILTLLGLQYYFINTTSGVAMYEGRRYWRYVQVKGKKPL
ncbi:MAG: hypothetical protein LQ340_005871 [Diploschistes diacapsis]|nr:MAG: hypothetical protein LQ340_005871 [Diploschistes diacapsis]